MVLPVCGGKMSGRKQMQDAMNKMVGQYKCSVKVTILFETFIHTNANTNVVMRAVEKRINTSGTVIMQTLDAPVNQYFSSVVQE